MRYAHVHNAYLFCKILELIHMCEFLGQKPDPADYFKSSSCPKITSSITQRENMTVGSTTITADTTTPSDNQRRNIDSAASENLDPSHNVTPQYVSMLIAPSVGSSRSSSIEMSGGSYTSQSSSVSIVGEKRIRQRVGKNLLGSTQSASPLTPRYDYHSRGHCKSSQVKSILFNSHVDYRDDYFYNRVTHIRRARKKF